MNQANSAAKNPLKSSSSPMAFPLLALAAVPVALCAWQTQFVRMLKDDFMHVAIGKELGAWQTWWTYCRFGNTGSYSDCFIHGSMAYLDTALPSIAALIYIALLFVGAAALATQTLARSSFRQARVAGLAVAALVVGASISALDLEVFYWYAANTRYVLPFAVLTIYIALVGCLVGRTLSSKRKIIMSIAGAAICFISAGCSEMAALFQSTLLLIALLATFAFADRKTRAPFVYWLGTGMLGTGLGIFVQVTAPGFHRRLDRPGSLANPIRSISALLDRSLDEIILLAGEPEVFRAFMLLFFAGLLAALLLFRPNQPRLAQSPATQAGGPFIFGLITQLLLLPLLWTHASDNGQVLGRFSYSYFSVVLLNAAFIIFYACLLWLRRRLELARIQHTSRLYVAFFSVILLLYALPQVRSITASADFYLHMCVVAMIVAFAWSMKIASVELRYPILFHAVTAILLLIMVLSSVYVQGFLYQRVIVGVTTMHIVSGAIWGLYIGMALKVNLVGGAKQFRRFAFLIALVIGMQVSFSLAEKIPNMAAYAREWDMRHQLLLEAKAAGLRELALPRMRYKLHRLEFWQDFDGGRRADEKTYYGLEQYSCHAETCRYVFRQNEAEDI